MAPFVPVSTRTPLMLLAALAWAVPLAATARPDTVPADSRVVPIAAQPTAAQPAAGQGTDLVSMFPPPVELTAQDVDTYLSAQNSFLDQGLRLERTESGAATASDAAMEVLDAHGLTPARMRSLGFSISLALSTLSRGPDQLEADLAASGPGLTQQMMTGSAEEAAFYQQQIDAARQMVDMMRSQPAGNLEVVSARRDELTTLLQRMNPRRAR
jgi:hypothetical protein